MNRTLVAATALLLPMLAALAARAQVPLVSGAVRDEQGAPIEGASITGRRVAGEPLKGTTDASGTFVLHGAAVVSILVTCRYCRPAQVLVRPEQPAVIIVHRYGALADDSPTPADLDNLPYANIESALALRPFTLLAQSSAPYPGSTLSDRGLSATGSLLVDAGAPNYDIVDGQSPYVLIPAQYERTADLQNAGNAYLYGDQAAGGIADLEPFATDTTSALATVGSDTILRVQAESNAGAIALGTFSDDQESRQRTDLLGNWQLAPNQSLQIAGGTEQGRVYESPESAFAGNFSFADAAFADANLANLSVTVVTDRGDYTATQDEYPTNVVWSDSGLSLGVHSAGPVVTFADLGVRVSTGLYDAQQEYEVPRIGATLEQTRADAGVRASGPDYNLTAGVGSFWIGYAGGMYGVSQPARAALAVPSFRAQLLPNGRWSADLQGSGSFTLPTLVGQYAYPPSPPSSVPYQRNGLLAATLTYTDQARLRLSFEEASQSVAGQFSGTVISAGLSAIWQVSPLLALRAWTMHVTDNVPLYGTTLPYDAVAPTVNALWLTYENGTGIRVDAIYRRDLLDGAPFYHVDGDVTGPLAARLRWYAGAEDRMRRTFVDAGLRFAGR